MLACAAAIYIGLSINFVSISENIFERIAFFSLCEFYPMKSAIAVMLLLKAVVFSAVAYLVVVVNNVGYFSEKEEVDEKMKKIPKQRTKRFF